MFECDFCHNYRDKSGCRENPTDDCGCICVECADAYEHELKEGKTMTPSDLAMGIQAFKFGSIRDLSKDEVRCRGLLEGSLGLDYIF